MSTAEEVKVYAEDSLLDLFTAIDGWNKEKITSVQISLQDLTLMMNHIEDLELELFGGEDTAYAHTCI